EIDETFSERFRCFRSGSSHCHVGREDLLRRYGQNQRWCERRSGHNGDEPRLVTVCKPYGVSGTGVKWKVDPAEAIQIVCEIHDLPAVMDFRRQDLAGLSVVGTAGFIQKSLHEQSLYGRQPAHRTRPSDDVTTRGISIE